MFESIESPDVFGKLRGLKTQAVVSQYPEQEQKGRGAVAGIEGLAIQHLSLIHI